MFDMFNNNNEIETSEIQKIRNDYHSRYAIDATINGLLHPKVDPTFVIDPKRLRLFAHLLKRGSSGESPENVLLQGPQGCGKTETSLQFAAHAGLPVLKVNCSLVREPRDWFGYKTVEGGDVKWERSEFAKLIERGGAVVLLDEISRATPPVLNALLPLLDRTGASFLEEVKQLITRGPDIYFFATANIGNQFTGTYGKLDKALNDRFAVRIKATYLSPDKEAPLLVQRTGVTEKVAVRLVKIANKVRKNSAAAFGGKLSETITTRNLLDTAVLYKSLGSDAFEFTILPLFSEKGGSSSQQAEVRQIIQSQFG